MHTPYQGPLPERASLAAALAASFATAPFTTAVAVTAAFDRVYHDPADEQRQRQ